jgi:hypothetical protein
MKQIVACAIALILTAQLCGCVDILGQLACEAEDGVWMHTPLGGPAFCNHRFPDGGTPCTSSDQCEGLCLSYDAVWGDPPQEGQCACLEAQFGCYYILWGDGLTDDLICVD